MVSFEREKTVVLQNYFIYCKNFHLNNLKVKNKNILGTVAPSSVVQWTLLFKSTSYIFTLI